MSQDTAGAAPTLTTLLQFDREALTIQIDQNRAGSPNIVLVTVFKFAAK